jgi:hypothetical protein
VGHRVRLALHHEAVALENRIALVFGASTIKM